MRRINFFFLEMLSVLLSLPGVPFARKNLIKNIPEE
ncbi:hypothetical protein OKW21_003683 [Catalinimonas alkaloidigena]|nr:hypothetical protein [Catalinimonas alkaloidigena]